MLPHERLIILLADLATTELLDTTGTVRCGSVAMRSASLVV